MFGKLLKVIFVVTAIPIITNCYNNQTTQNQNDGAVGTDTPTLRRFCFALDLKDDPNLIAEYEKYHRNVWPEIKASILASGVVSMEIYRIMNRLFMIVEANESFSLENKAAKDAADPKVQEWETLMWQYQQALPIAKPGQKWMKMDKIFELGASNTS